MASDKIKTLILIFNSFFVQIRTEQVVVNDVIKSICASQYLGNIPRMFL